MKPTPSFLRSFLRALFAPGPPAAATSPAAAETARDVGLLGLRLGFGLPMALVHGRGTLRGFPSHAGDFPDPLGLGSELSMALMILAELVCALLVAAGLLTRLALMPLMVGLGTAFFVFHAGDPFARKELAFLYLVVWIVLFCTGAGRFSLDRLLFGRGGRRGAARGSRGARALAAALALAILVGPSVLAAESRLEGDLPRRDGAPLEAIEGLESVFGVLETDDGVRLRTLLTRPEGAEGRLPALLFVQWLSCDTVEVAADRQDGWARMLRRVIAESGLVVLRTDKAGVGDSEGGPCSELGYDREVAHHRRALEHLLAHPWVDPERVVVFGASMGATMAPLLAADQDLLGVIAWGGGALPWRERTLGFERQFREGSRVPGDRIQAEMERIAALLDAYLVAGRHPREIAAEDPQLGTAWDLLVGTDRWSHYGRPPRFHQEAQRHDWAAAWEAVEAPALVLFGEHDWFESRAGHALAVERASRGGAEARLVTFPGLDHHFERYPSAEAAVAGEGGEVAEGPVVETILAWLDRVVGAGSSTLSSYRRGEARVRRALEALGGPGALEAAGGVSWRGEGWLDLSVRMQGTHPERSERVRAEKSLAYEAATGRLGWESHAAANPDADEWVRFLHEPADGGERMRIALPLEGRAFYVPGDPEQRRRTLRSVPHVLLADALDRRATLRHLGPAGDREAVAFTLASGETLTLLFDPATGHLAGVEYLLDLPLRGDTVVRWEYLEPRPVDGLGPYPSGHRILLGGRPLEEIRYRTVRAGVAGAEVLGLPEGVEPPPAPTPPAEAVAEEAAADAPAPEASDLPEIREIAGGVHLVRNVRGGFHPLLVELADKVVVVDAPAGHHELQTIPALDWAGDVTSSSVGRRLLAAVRAVAPGKPIHLVVTHHHGDHAGGVRPFLAAGATVHASAIAASVVRAAARARFELAPDGLSGRETEIELDLRIVDGETVLTDGERSVRILDVGDNPHADGMLAVYLPEQRILYQSDLFMPATGAFPDPARVPVMRWFVDWLDASGLEPEAIYAIHGSARVTEEQLERIRALPDRPRAP